MTIGTRRLGMNIKCCRDGASNPCIYAVIWIARGKMLSYWYPAITLVGYRPIFSIQ